MLVKCGDFMPEILVLNGPNLNLLGHREPDIYGRTTLEDLAEQLHETAPADTTLTFFQTNHEGDMIERIQALLNNPVTGVIFNPGAWTHTSVAIRDAVASVKPVLVEVHISNVHQREPFRQTSYFSDLAIAVIAGCGLNGYHFALQTILNHSKDH
jgi:3-dehydroquinate dehydratase-2